MSILIINNSNSSCVFEKNSTDFAKSAKMIDTSTSSQMNYVAKILSIF